MPAYDYETEDALAEGVDVQLLRSISSIKKNKIHSGKNESGKRKSDWYQ